MYYRDYKFARVRKYLTIEKYTVIVTLFVSALVIISSASVPVVNG